MYCVHRKKIGRIVIVTLFFQQLLQRKRLQISEKSVWLKLQTKYVRSIRLVMQLVTREDLSNHSIRHKSKTDNKKNQINT